MDKAIMSDKEKIEAIRTEVRKRYLQLQDQSPSIARNEAMKEELGILEFINSLPDTVPPSPMDKEIIRNEIERRYNCEKQYPNDREACVAATVLNELLLFIDAIPENDKNFHIKPQKQMEDYKKKYEEALERMKSWAKGEHPECFSEAQKTAEFVFPELKESEEERIRKELIAVFKGEITFTSEEMRQKYIAWLEKQGEQANPYSGISFEYNGHIWGMCARDSGVDILLDGQFLKHFENFGEQTSTDKTEPKFKVGDTIRPKGSLAEYTIESISGECYHGKGWGLLISCDDDYELVEQKPTDKVEPKFKVGEWIRYKGENYEIKDIEITKNGFIYNVSIIGNPSDPEEVKTAIGFGGEKDIVKIEQPVWSEEDEEMFDAIIADIQFTQKAHTHEVNQVVYEREIDWLKSLKEKMKGE